MKYWYCVGMVSFVGKMVVQLFGVVNCFYYVECQFCLFQVWFLFDMQFQIGGDILWVMGCVGDFCWIEFGIYQCLGDVYFVGIVL